MVLVESRSGQSDIGAIVEETFSRMFNKAPDYIEKIEILPEPKYNERIKELDGKLPHKENWGVTFRNTKTGKFLILVKEENDSRTMSYIGHEIGHTLYPLFDKVPGLKSFEEAKAYSFQYKWADIIARYNIGGLGQTIGVVTKNVAEGPQAVGVKGGVHYFGSLIANVIDKDKPGRLFDLMNSTKNHMQLAYNLIEKVRYKITPN